jgi:hypothetical protein
MGAAGNIDPARLTPIPRDEGRSSFTRLERRLFSFYTLCSEPSQWRIEVIIPRLPAHLQYTDYAPGLSLYFGQGSAWGGPLRLQA